MANSYQRNFNGATLTLGGTTQGKVVSISLKQGGEKSPSGSRATS